MADLKIRVYNAGNKRFGKCSLFVFQVLLLLILACSVTNASFVKGTWYLGCFPDTSLLGSDQDLYIPGDVVQIGHGSLSDEEIATRCGVKCASTTVPYKYAMSSNRGLCLCSSTATNASTEALATSCNRQTCNFTSEYSICDGETYHRLINTSSQLNGVKLVNNEMLRGLAVESVTAATIPAKFPGALFAFDFGDGSTTNNNPSEIYHYLYTEAGYYRISVNAKTSKNVTVSADKVLQVVIPPNGIFFDVPVVFESNVDVSYSIAVREGTNMTISVESTGSTLTLPIEDAGILAVGVPVAYFMASSFVVSNPNVGTYIIPKTTFTSSGLVSGFEVLVSKAGHLQFQVYRPTCGSFPGQSFCAEFRNCTTLTCPTVNMLTTVTPQVTAFDSLAPADYKLVSEVIFLVNFTGYKYLKVKNTNMQVQRGDVIGIKLTSSGGDVSHSVTGSAAEYFYTSPANAFPGDQFLASGSTKKTIEHTIRVHLSTKSVVKKTDRFTKAGVATVKATATNVAGTYTDNKIVQVQDRIIDFKISSPKSYSVQAYPHNETLTITTTTTKGSNISYAWVITYPVRNFTYNVSKTLDFMAPIPGMYTVFVKGSNLINSDNDTVKFEILQKIEKLIVHNKTDGKILTPAGKKLNLTVTVIKGTNVTLEATYGTNPAKSLFIPDASLPSKRVFQFDVPSCEKTTMKVKAQNRLPGPKTEDLEVVVVCPITELKVTATPVFSLVNGGSQVIMATNKKLELKVNIKTGSFVFYKFENGYDSKHQTKDHSTLITPKQIIYEIQYSQQGTYTATISATNTFSKKVFTFKVIVQDCPPPTLTITGSSVEGNPTYVTRGEDFVVTGSLVRASCNANGQTTFAALLYQLGNQTALETTVLSDANLRYVLRKGTRPAGRYKVTFKQDNVDSNGKKDTILHDSYVNIKQSDLVAVIKSGTSRIIPRKKRLNPKANTTSFYDVILDGSASFDPDNSMTKLKYEWHCRGSKLPKLTAVQKANLSCFDTNFQKLNGTSKTLNINTVAYLANITYDFVIKVMEGTRVSNYTQKIELILGEPPAVEFECVTNCDTKWNNQEKIILKGKCPNCVDVENIVYKWELLDKLGKSVPKVDQNNDPKVTLTGWNKQSLVINAAQLLGSTEYSLKLTANYKDSSQKKTVVVLSRSTSVIPAGGACTIAPETGTVAKTPYQIKCDHWKTIDIPIKYQFMTKPISTQAASASSDASQDYPIWYAGSQPWNPANILPQGDATKNYTLEIVIRVFNVYGAYKELDPKVIKVLPVATSSGNGSESAAAAVIKDSKPKSNDSSSLSQWAASAASILNAEEPKQPSSGESGGTATAAPQTETQLEKITEIRTSIITSLSNADMKDISLPNLKQLGDSLTSVTSKPNQLSEAAQDVGSAFLTKMAETLASTDSRTGADMLQQTSMAIMGPLSNLMDATTQSSESYLNEADSISSDEGISATSSPTQGMTTKQTPTKQAQIQKKASRTKNKVESYMKTLNLVSKRLLENKVVGETSMVTKTKSFELALEKRNYNKLANASFNTGDTSLGVVMPDLAALASGVRRNGSGLSDQDEISCQTTVMNKIMQTWDIENAKSSASSIQSLELLSQNYESLTVKNLSSDIKISVKNRPEKLNFTKIKLGFPQEMQIVQQQVKSLDTPFLVQFDSPDTTPSNLTVLIQFGQPPSKLQYDIRLDVTNSGIGLSKNTGNVTNPSNTTGNSTPSSAPLVRNSNIRIIDSKTIIMWNFSDFTYGKIGKKDIYFNFYYHGDMPTPLYVPNEFTFDLLEVARYRNYSMRTFSCSCLYWSVSKDKWAGMGCKVNTQETDFNKTVCQCNHLTSFGGFYVKPTPIPPLTGAMFLEGYVVFVCVSSALLLFIIGLVLARRADKKDIHKVGVCPLPDNKPENHYLYEITVWTGMRRGAGTNSNVYFILSGDNGDTEIRNLKDPNRTTFQKSSSDVFVFSTEHALGDLSHIRVWHDNSGGGWYLRKVVVMDLQTDKNYQFLCNRWLAVDHDDGQVEMVAPVSGKEELKDFNYVFLTKTRNDLTDSHLWFSVYARPPRSPFTRVQRLACCMSLLMTSMLASAIFYKQTPKPTPQTANYAAGLTFTWQQVYVALISTAITVPINAIIVTLFRSTKPKDGPKISKVSPSRAGSRASIADNTSMKSMGSSTLSQSDSPQFGMQQNIEMPLLEPEGRKKSQSVNVKVEADEKKTGKAKKATKEPFLFPHWCIYVSWFLATASIIASSVVVIIYGMIFANSKSWEWLSSITLSLVSDIIVIQPIKVFIIAIFFALIIKKVEDDQPQLEEHGKKLAQDEEWLHSHADTTFSTPVDTMTLRPPDHLKLDAMRQLRYKERKMNAISREILLYSFYVFITLTISYSLREEQGYWQTIDIEELFNLKIRDGVKFPVKTDQFRNVLSYNDFWPWAERILVPSLFPDPWYPNKAYPAKTRQFPGKLYINDLNHKLVNGVRIRQVRVKHDSCDKPESARDVIKIDCNAPYGYVAEDQSSAIGNWSTTAKSRPAITRVNQPWVYQTWKELDGYPFLAELTTYYGGGYTLDLFPRWPNIANLKNLKAKQWLDRHTRAVLIEFALFNPSTNHFSAVTMVFEFAATGGCIHYHSVHTFKLYRYTTGFAFFTIVCEVLFLLLLLLYLYREIKEWYKLRSAYFTQFWNLIEVSINLLSLATIGFYFYREKLANDLLKKLPTKQPDVFINFQFAAYCDQIFIYIISLIVFFVSIKFIKLLRFNRRMGILADTLKDAWYPLGMFSIIMGIVLFGSFAFGTIVFGVEMYSYRNLLVTASTQVSLLLGKFNFYEYQQTNRIIGPLFFFGYIIMVNWILMNMFVSIINDSYETVTNNISQQSNEYEIVDFVIDRFKEWVGFGRTKKSKIEHNIRWDSAKTKVDAMRAFSAGSKAPKKGDHSKTDEGDLGGLAHSVYWHYTPTFDGSVIDRELDVQDVNKTVDRFIDCINLLYFDDVETAEKMSKKVKQEISDADFLEHERLGELKP